MSEEEEKLYIQVYDMIGCDYFCKGNDDQLRQWGNSEEKIKEIKVSCVEFELSYAKDSINIYKILNKLKGGVNKV